MKRSISEQNSHTLGISDGENFSKLEGRHPRPPPPPNPPPRGQRRPPPPLPPNLTSPTSPMRPAQPNPPGPAKPNVPVQSQGTDTLQHLFTLLLSLHCLIRSRKLQAAVPYNLLHFLQLAVRLKTPHFHFFCFLTRSLQRKNFLCHFLRMYYFWTNVVEHCLECIIYLPN